jgi:SET domain-containing protein
MNEPVLKIVETSNGKGVVALQPIKSGDFVINFCGPILSGDNLPSPYSSVDDHYVQVGDNLYMGPSHKEDDYINHSCNPNCRLISEGGQFYLEAIRDIKANEEVTWDYSTYIDEATRAQDLKGWVMECTCGSTACRKEVGDFRFLPKETTSLYIQKDMFPDFILNQLDK